MSILLGMLLARVVNTTRSTDDNVMLGYSGLV